MTTLYASFNDASLAEKAAGSLLDYGVRKEDISLVANETHAQNWANSDTFHSTTAYSTTPGTVGGRIGNDAAWTGDKAAQGFDRAAGAVTGAVGASNVSAGFNNAADQRSFDADTRSGGTAVSGYATDQSDLNEMSEDDETVHNDNSTELSAKHGISTTTPGDAGAGAAKGAGIGLGVGILAGLAAITIPGFGILLGSGALATAMGAAAATTAAGAVAGGVTGYLKDQGIPDEAVQRYDTTIKNGGAMLAITLPSGDVDEATAEQVLSKYGATDFNTY